MDIINEIIRDHRRLRELLDRIKSKDAALRTKKAAFRELVPLVKAHAQAEEKSLYEFGRKKRALKLDTLEGFEEHAAAMEMAVKARRTSTPELWEARAVVFCEMLEHHLDEEEDDYFPELRKFLSTETSNELAARYRALMPPADIKATGKRLASFLRPITGPLEAFIP